jgi:DNA-binding response OmpR family regulator
VYVRILVVVDESDARVGRLTDALSAAAHDVRVVAPSEAPLALCAEPPDVLVVDAAAADLLRSRPPGLTAAAWLAAASSERTATLLEQGADDVLHAGMGDREHVARVAALARRVGAAHATVDAGPLHVDRERGDVTWHGRRLRLTARERDVLHALAAASGSTVRREALYRQVWGYAMARGDRTVDVTVKRLRDRLAAEIGPPLAVETETGIGYRLVVSDQAVTAL